jgi:NTP pyrophosphatase (non-canonical NTP hydrolase)
MRDGDVPLREYAEMVHGAAIYREGVDALVESASKEDLAKMLRIFYAATGLAGEAGEVANKVKKILRDNGGVVDDEVRQRILGELGGVAWYLNAAAEEFDLRIEDVLNYNYDQITDRQARNVIKGDGDDR